MAETVVHGYCCSIFYCYPHKKRSESALPPAAHGTQLAACIPPANMLTLCAMLLLLLLHR
jgi:hypothetical protein